MIKNPTNSPCIRLNFQAKRYFSKQGKVASAVLYSLIKHAKISQSQSLVELFKNFDWLTRQQLSITNWTSAKLSVSSWYPGEEWCLLSSFFSLILKWGSKGFYYKGIRHIAAHKNVHRFKWKLRNKELKTSEYWVVFERSCQGAQYSCLRLAAACSKIARSGVKVGKTRLLPLVLLRVKENIRATDHLSSERWY